MSYLRRDARIEGSVSRIALLFGSSDSMQGRSRSVVFGPLPTRPHDAIRTALRRMHPKRRPFTNRMRIILRRRMEGLEPLSSDFETESKTETEEKLSLEATTSTTLPSSSMQEQEQDLQADAPPLKLEDVIPPPTQASSSRNKKKRNKKKKKLVSKTTPPPN
ncbi:uncharacterized protein LOC130495181 isoform X2 [Raphanus sativus]|uniref:Uncharacterized protein LOC130495181 isoform X2 n=1 Tax=Raphanus sativus TaxID=3726 RepID=A0A9W3BTD6_RAPSA|nr:uncharacterized protein LOC130495181 isoform X2 [Raphanus sativus]